MRKNASESVKNQMSHDTFIMYRLCCWVFPAAVVAVVIFWLWGYDITHTGRVCSFFRTTHFYCPGCGGTRSFNALVHFHLIESIKYNFAVCYAALAYFGFTIYSHIRLHIWKKLPELSPFVLLYIGLTLLLLQWFLRNILFFAWGITYI